MKTGEMSEIELRKIILTPDSDVRHRESALTELLKRAMTDSVRTEWARYPFLEPLMNRGKP